MEAFQTNPASLQHLLSAIHERELALPDFQRDFVWDARATEGLLESISRSFPAGSLLFMSWREDTFSPREIQGAPSLDGCTPLKLILDGQQRLSSLYQACYGVGEYRYFVDFKPLLEDDDVEEAIFYRHKNRAGRYATVEQQAEQLVLPLGVLFGGDGFHAWLEQLTSHLEMQPPELTTLRTAVREAYERSVKPIEDYRFPVVELAPGTSLEAVCSIFETLNKTGIKLSVFDLLAARFYAHGLDLRRMWEQTVELHPIIEEFEINRYYVLQSVALRARGSVKRGDVLELSVGDIAEHWESVTAGYRAALEMLRDECGVLTAKWLPYGYLLVPLAAIWDQAIEIGGPASAANRSRLQRWFWCSGISAAYDRAANTQAGRDYAELSRWIGDGPEPATVAEFSFQPDRLREITPKQQAIYKALMAVVLRNKAKDFHRGTELTASSIAARRVDDHHIFPRAYLNPTDETPAYPRQLVDCILNRTLIDAETNQRIGKRPPNEYLGEVREEFVPVDHDAFGEVLSSHILPAGEDSPLMQGDFPAFLDWREARIAAEIAALTETSAATPA
ncbi:MAG TPA: DUF262 domain-containing protein [Solirubrobacterales bacterium]|nr:DUF262 domain-containing protein [Solirubrobacterales bacterium]